MSNPLVSVIIPTYNKSDLLFLAIKSALGQSYRPFEVVVVDDCSTDSTKQIVEDLIESNSNLKYVSTTNQSNLPAIPRNLGIRKASGDFVAFLDHDDLWMPNKLEIQMQYFLLDPSLDMVYSPLWPFVSKPNLTGLLYLRSPVGHRDLYKSLCQLNFIQCSSVVAKKTAIEDLGGFNVDPNLRAVEDYDLWLRMAMFKNLKEIYKLCGYYRIVNESTSSTENMKVRLNYLSSIHQNLRVINEQNSWKKYLGKFVKLLRIFSNLIFQIRVIGKTLKHFSHY
jgi:teichuronic acid biosynthesis glycosyltransferase TuaG